MSDLEDSFLQQIASQPHDWEPRLLLADWLEEQDDPRYMLIRLSYELPWVEDDERRAELETWLLRLAANEVTWPSPSLPNSLDLKLVLIPLGRFLMGSWESEQGRGENEDQVDVILTQGFWLGQYQVTQAEWAQIMGTTIEQQAETGTTTRELAGTGDAHPMYYVSWEDATEFCRRLTGQERAGGRLPPDWEYTLPTEAQWEYACRAGTSFSPTAFGARLGSQLANFNGAYPYNSAAEWEYNGQTIDVGSYCANAWDLYDMHGNVWEWCRDWYNDRLPGGTDPDVQERAEYDCRVCRGGSWASSGDCCRSAYRDSGLREGRYNILGFRVAVVPVR